jgi:ABC-type multidrug transport system permease subunit
MVISGVSIFGLLVAAAKFTGSNMEFPIGWVLCGIFWPVALLPAVGYLAAGWYLNRKNMNNE